jgi:ABC-2 type transport system permease protein
MWFTDFWRRNLACASLAIRQQLEYRFNFLVDVAIQPLFTAVIEMAVWYAIFSALDTPTLAGQDRNSYLSYVFWGAFFGRHVSTWQYDFRMVDEIQSGSINSVIVRPISYFEYYLGQFLGHKAMTLGFSLLVPTVFSLLWEGPTNLSRLPVALGLSFFYLIFIFSISYWVSSFGFFMTRINSILMGKNIALWMLTGELFPLDLLPESWRFIWTLPFASGVFLPVGYLTGRVGYEILLEGLVNLLIGIAIVQVLAFLTWRAGMKRYSGVGA